VENIQLIESIDGSKKCKVNICTLQMDAKGCVDETGWNEEEVGCLCVLDCIGVKNYPAREDENAKDADLPCGRISFRYRGRIVCYVNVPCATVLSNWRRLFFQFRAPFSSAHKSPAPPLAAIHIACKKDPLFPSHFWVLIVSLVAFLDYHTFVDARLRSL